MAAVAFTPGTAQADFAFGTPGEDVAFASTGYSGVVRGGYSFQVGDNFSIAGEFILDVGTFYSIRDGAPGTVTVAGAAPMKLTLMDTDQFVLGLTAAPGLGVGFFEVTTVSLFEETTFSTEPFFALLLHFAGNFGYKLTEDLILGGGIDMPFTLYFGDFDVFFFPVLFGPTAEYQILDALKLFGEFKLGPHVGVSDGNTSTATGLKFMVGATYSF